MERPLDYDSQDDEIKCQFNQLKSAIYSIHEDWSLAECMALNEHIQREVTAKPILARIMKGQHTREELSLLSVACSNLGGNSFLLAIKCLIRANPSALLWETGNHTRITLFSQQIYMIVRHSFHCVLMPWIAEKYRWVLDHEICLEDPPVFYLLELYVSSNCNAGTIRQFFEAYPRGITQKNHRGCNPLHIIPTRGRGCNRDLFQWVAQQCPSNMSDADRDGETPLHYACWMLAGNHFHSSEICRYLIEYCPESVRASDDQRRLPIRILLDRCQHQFVKEVVVCLLREYPGSYDLGASLPGDVTPSSIPFIQRIKPLLDEESELKENLAYLQEVSGVFQDAVDGTENPSPLSSSTCNAFGNWATVSFVQRLEAKMALIITELQDECNAD